MQGHYAAVREIMVNSQLSTTGFSYSKHLDYGTQAYMGTTLTSNYETR